MKYVYMGERFCIYSLMQVYLMHADDFLIKQGLVLPRHFKIVYQKEAQNFEFNQEMLADSSNKTEHSINRNVNNKHT